jgi:hypothetical protein
MSWRSRTIATLSSCALLIVLAFVAAPSAALTQSPGCYPIRRVETATQLARRITGDGRNKYQPWFQIMDPSSRVVPKSQYDRIRPGWRACIVKEAIERVPPATQFQEREVTDVPAVRVGSPEPTSAVALRPISGVAWSLPNTSADALRAIDGVDLTWVWLGGAVILPLFAWKIVDGYASRRRSVSIVMEHFALRFLREFERPLIQRPAEHPVRSQLRLSPARARLEILLAPGQGRRYPNLSDHKKNMEYDVVRILQVLADDSFVRDPLYTQAGWVVVPFRFKAGRKHAGVT